MLDAGPGPSGLRSLPATSDAILGDNLINPINYDLAVEAIKILQPGEVAKQADFACAKMVRTLKAGMSRRPTLTQSASISCAASRANNNANL